MLDGGRRQACVVLGLAVLVLAVGGSMAHGASGMSFVVNSRIDEPDADWDDGACLTESGKCSLRAAIEQANATAGADN